MNKSRLIAIVDGILGNDSLCSGCQYGETKGHEEYGSCDNCRRVAADEIIEILKREDRPTGKWLKSDGTPYGEDPVGSCWCSECGKCLVASEEYDVDNNFCPNCGAKMEVTQNERSNTKAD